MEFYSVDIFLLRECSLFGVPMTALTSDQLSRFACLIVLYTVAVFNVIHAYSDVQISSDKKV